MPAPRKYPQELRERSQRLVSEAMAEDPSLAMNQAVLRIGPSTFGHSPRPLYCLSAQDGTGA